MKKLANKNLERQRRHARIRTKVSGTSACPRLCVFRSNKHIHAQIRSVHVESVMRKRTIERHTIS